MKQNILVTGAAGYLGSVLCAHLLDAEYRIAALDPLIYDEQNLNHLCADPDFNFIRGDARDEAVMKGVVGNADAIIPLAAEVGAPACGLDPYLATSFNRDAITLLCALPAPPGAVYGYRCSRSFVHIDVPYDYRRAQLLFSQKDRERP